jgi:hypothetical protein
MQKQIPQQQRKEKKMKTEEKGERKEGDLVFVFCCEKGSGVQTKEAEVRGWSLRESI